MTKRHRRANLGVTNKEIQTMSNGDTWNGIPTSTPPGPGVSLPSNVIMTPENCPHYYDENGTLQVVAIAPDSQGNMPPIPPPQYQAPGFHVSNPKPSGGGTTTPDWIKVGSPPDPFTPGWTDNPATNPAAQWVVGIDASGNYIYGAPPATGGSVQAQIGAIVAAALELSKVLAGKKAK